ncbi:MAG: LysR family transcriptional regulator, partial [Pseudomonadota bacterium]
VAEHTGPMDGAANDLMRKLRGRDETLSGPFVVTAPQLLIAHFLAPALDQFCKAHPGVALKVRATNELLDLNRREADLALRISRNPGDNLKGLRLSEQHTAGFATPAMAEQLAADPSAPVDWLVYAQVPGLPKSVRQAFPNARIRMEFDDMVAMIWAAQAGLGAVRAPMFLGRNVPGLVQIPHLDPQPYADVWIVGHPDIWASAKSMAFREIMVRFFRAERAVFLADPPT